MNTAEKDRIMAHSELLERQLYSLGYSCGVDAGNKKTPGQKMRGWEEKGVSVRIEVGPKEAQLGA